MTNRELLDKILQENAEKNWWQPKLFKEHVEHLLPKELEILEYPPTKEENYNCFMYALGLHQHDAIRRHAKGFIYDTFFTKLIDHNELEKINTPKDGDYIVYWDAQKPDELHHVGVIKNNKVISKWSWGPLLKHEPWDVPASYGDDIFYVRSINIDKAIKLYREYKQFNKLPDSE